MRLAEFRIIPRLEKYPRVVQFAQTIIGKIILIVCFAVALKFHGRPWWQEMTFWIAVITFLPQFRRQLVLIATLYWLTFHTWFDWVLIRTFAAQAGATESIQWLSLRPICIALVLMFCAIFYYMAERWRDVGPMRRPVITLHVINLSLLAFASYAPLPPIEKAYVWGFVIVMSHYIWFLGYSLLDIRTKNPAPLSTQMGYWLPFWIGMSSSPAPMPKGATYIAKIEAKNAEELAIAQLKGLKLIYWAYILIIVETVFNNLIHNNPGILHFTPIFSLHLPTFPDAFQKAITGNPYPWYLNWLSLLASLFTHVLYVAIWGHVIIATCRMAGYNALRGTYKPLLATNIAEFWNRYFYYFKELLVEFFFYPTYLRYFKKHPRTRLFVATLAAAGFGNVLFHFIRDIEYILPLGLWEAFLAFHVYMFYGLILGIAIGISQIRQSKRRKMHTWPERITGSAGVILFYCFILVFDEPDRHLKLQDHFVFIASLFNI